jgi:hypothetical protein
MMRIGEEYINIIYTVARDELHRSMCEREGVLYKTNVMRKKKSPANECCLNKGMSESNDPMGLNERKLSMWGFGVYMWHMCREDRWEW